MAQGQKQSHKDRLQNETEEEEEDFFNTVIDKSGCAEFHYALQDCYFEQGDWRKCTKEMEEFRKCMNKQSKHTKKT